jgi:4a-hydroxytetrahydrobiopterin dehydratase
METLLWQEKDNSLVKEFSFPTFTAAIEFINQVAIIAERLNHHPQIINMYNKVTLTLSTHDAGDIVTDKDRTLATAIDTVVL